MTGRRQLLNGSRVEGAAIVSLSSPETATPGSVTVIASLEGKRGDASKTRWATLEISEGGVGGAGGTGSGGIGGAASVVLLAQEKAGVRKQMLAARAVTPVEDRQALARAGRPLRLELRE